MITWELEISTSKDAVIKRLNTCTGAINKDCACADCLQSMSFISSFINQGDYRLHLGTPASLWLFDAENRIRGRKRNISMSNILYSGGFYAFMSNIHFPIQQNAIPITLWYCLFIFIDYEYSVFLRWNLQIFNILCVRENDIQYSAPPPKMLQSHGHPLFGKAINQQCTKRRYK